MTALNEATTPTRPGRFLGLSMAFLAAALHFCALRAVGAYMGGEPSTLFAVFILPAVITLWVLPPARRHGLHRWPVLWLLFYTSTVPFPVLIIGETWLFYRFYAVEFPGQHKWSHRADEKTAHAKVSPQSPKGNRGPQDRLAKKTKTT